MAVTVKIPAPLRPLTQNQAEVTVEKATTVGRPSGPCPRAPQSSGAGVC